MGWITITIDQRNFQFYYQTLNVECGPASVAMVAAAMGKGMSINDSRSLVRSMEKVNANYAQNWNQDWTNSMRSLVQVLSSRGIRDAMYHSPGSLPDYRVKLRSASPNHPAILRAYQPYGHFLVCVGQTATQGIFNLMDPEVPTGHVLLNTNSNNGYLGYNRGGTWFYLDLHRIITTN